MQQRPPCLVLRPKLLACVALTWASLAHGETPTGDDGAGDGDTTSAAEAETETASEGPDQAACLAAHSKAQALKKETRFIEAQEQLFICSSASCPGPVIADCGGWIEELDRRTPSLAFSVRRDGVEAREASVSLDGKPVTDRSVVVKVNPGRHVVRVELAPFAPREEVVFARDAAGTQVVRIEFQTEKPVSEASAPSTASYGDAYERPTPTIVYPLLGLSAAGFASFGVFAWIGNERQRELEKECEPNCTDDEVQPMKNAYMIGDISLAVGAASLLGAGIIYLARPSRPVMEEARAGLRLDIQPVVGKDSFGVVAAQTW